MNNPTSNDYSEVLININLFNTVFHIIVDVGFGGSFLPSRPSIHSHSYYEVFIIENGEALLNIEDRSIPLTGGKYYIIAPNVYHKVSPVDDKDFHTSVFRFNYSKNAAPKDVAYEYGVTVEELQKISVYSHLLDPDINELVQKISTELNTAEFGCRSMVNAYFEILMIKVLRGMVPKTKTGYKIPICRKHEKWSAIIETFFDNFREQLTAQHLANELNVSVRQLSRILQKMYGCSFKQKLIAMKIQEAKHLLKTTDKSIEEISILVGYSAVQNFYRVFKRETGLSPTDYRRSV